LKPLYTPEEFRDRMILISMDENTWYDDEHMAADNLMTELLKSLGYREGCQVFEDMEKEYS
jgi:hypothetical protein